ncbi:polyprenyl synthetase family protein [Candidatus Woesearchaeota archaeon]|nr:polyprenyl synthetase family protein [Candidatus Woesearchaeota archaeon]
MSFHIEYKELKSEIDNDLREYVRKKTASHNSVNNIYDIIAKNCTADGKRLRPVLFRKACSAVGGNIKSARTLSLSVELLHASTLIHDDVMDQDMIRRNQPTIHKILSTMVNPKITGPVFKNTSVQYGVSIAICAGNVLVTWAWDVLKEHPVLLNHLIKTYEEINQGQIMDLHYSKANPSPEDVFSIYELKSGRLLQASICMGAMLGGAKQEVVDKLKDFALPLSLAFQMQDDLLDLKEGKGREKYSDIREKKATMLKVIAKSRANQHSRELFDKDPGDEVVAKIAALYESTGAVSQVKDLAEEKIIESKRILETIPLKDKSFFEGFADFMLERNN